MSGGSAPVPAAPNESEAERIARFEMTRALGSAVQRALHANGLTTFAYALTYDVGAAMLTALAAHDSQVRDAALTEAAAILEARSKAAPTNDVALLNAQAAAAIRSLQEGDRNG